MRIAGIMVLFVIIIVSCEALPRGKIVPYVDNDDIDRELQNIDIKLADQRHQVKQEQIKKEKEELEHKLKENIANLTKRIKELQAESRQGVMNKAKEIRAINISLLITAIIEKKAEESADIDLISQARDIKQKMMETVMTGRSKYSHVEFLSKITALMKQALAIYSKIKMQT